MRFRLISGAVAVTGIVVGIPSLWAQDLGDVARQDRERRSRLSRHVPVLTNEDLARERILTPELKYRILTAQSDPGAAASQDAPSTPSASTLAAQLAGEQVPPPDTVGMVLQLHSSTADQTRRVIEIVPPAVGAQTLPSRTLAYSEPAVAVTAAIGEPVSLGEYARQLRAYRDAHLNVQLPDAASAEGAVADSRDDGISLGEYARQLQSRRVVEPLVARGPAAGETPADARQSVSLGAYARRLRALRSLQTAESASITALTPRTEIRTLPPEISLGEYARQLRIRRAAEEYARLLAQDDTAVAAALAGDAIPVRYREIRRSVVAQSLHQRRVAAQVAETRNNPSPAREGHIAVTVRRGDSLWRLARTYLGSGARWQSISFLHRHPGSPQLIRAGEVVLIPLSDRQRVRASDVASRRFGSPLR